MQNFLTPFHVVSPFFLMPDAHKYGFGLCYLEAFVANSNTTALDSALTHYGCRIFLGPLAMQRWPKV